MDAKEHYPDSNRDEVSWLRSIDEVGARSLDRGFPLGTWGSFLPWTQDQLRSAFTSLGLLPGRVRVDNGEWPWGPRATSHALSPG